MDHAIPFALWGNNDLWNLVPTEPRVNLSKSDMLPATELLEESKPRIVASWEILRDRLPEAFDRQARALTGESLSKTGVWPEKLFSRFREAVEFTALQRGVERWSVNGGADMTLNAEIKSAYNFVATRRAGQSGSPFGRWRSRGSLGESRNIRLAA